MTSNQFGTLQKIERPPGSGKYAVPRTADWNFLVAGQRGECEISAMDNDEIFMRRAIELARAGMNRGAGGPFGAVVVKDGAIVGEGWNQVLANNDPTAHGEITAIRDACGKLGTFSLDGCEIHTTGQPCPMCLGAIHWARISKIHYGFRIEDAAAIGFDDSEFFRQMTLPLEQRAIPSHELCRAEALVLAREYSMLPGRRHY